MLSQRQKNSSAFSLIEISVVLLIIGILIAGIFTGQVLVTKFRLATSQSLTKSSPVHSIKNSALWLETSLDDSFNDSESNDESSLSTWYEQRVSDNKVTLTAVSDGPTYSNSINYVRAVKFANSGYFTFDGSFLNSTDYTIFVLEKRESSSSGNYFLGDSSVTTSNQTLLLGYSSSGQVTHSQGGTNSYASLVSSYSESSGSPRIFTFVQDSTDGKKTYVNGILAATSSNTTQLSGISTLSLGKGYTGQIGELIIFTRALKSSEIESIEDYLGKKWNSKINRTVASSCIDGTVTLTGCDSGSGTVTCDVSVAGVSSTTAVSVGSGTLTCDSSHYTSSTIPYTCSGGILSTSSSCTCDTGYTGSTCSTCDTGYSESSGSCVIASTLCTGGTIDTSSVSGYAIHTFTSSGTFTCPSSKTVAVLVVAGGGGGSDGDGGVSGGVGGGAGGVVYNSSFSVSTSDITVTVGDGGPGAGGSGHNYGTNGEDSVFSTITAIGGGGGGKRAYSGLSGGSGGGAGIESDSRSGGSATSGQGYAGGSNSPSGPHYCGGGGGGAGGVGGTGTSTVAGNGGVGLSNSITGTATYYGGGGGSSCYPFGSSCDGVDGSGGLGGGGNGGGTNNGTDNLGGGGGGSQCRTTNAAGDGGSGVVIVRYSTS